MARFVVSAVVGVAAYVGSGFNPVVGFQAFAGFSMITAFKEPDPMDTSDGSAVDERSKLEDQ